MSDRGSIRIRTCSTLNAGMDMVNGQLAGLDLHALDEQIRAASTTLVTCTKQTYMILDFPNINVPPFLDSA